MHLMLALTVLLAASPSPVVGKWAVGGEVLFEFKGNGKGVTDGEPFRWKVQGNNLVLTADGEREVVPFQVSGDTLVLMMGGIPLQLQRVGGKARAAAPTDDEVEPAAPRAAPKAARVNTKDPLAKLLLSSAWCTFRYNATTGYSSSTRVQFFPDGTYSRSSQGEGYSSGPGGSFASQRNTGDTGQWTVRGGTLHVNQPPEQPSMVPFPVQVKKNSNGYPIIVADGSEYSQCN